MKKYILSLTFCVISLQAMQLQHQYDSLICELRTANQQLTFITRIIKTYRDGFYSTCYEKQRDYALIYAPRGNQKVNREVLSHLKKQQYDAETTVLILKSRIEVLRSRLS